MTYKQEVAARLDEVCALPNKPQSEWTPEEVARVRSEQQRQLAAQSIESIDLRNVQQAIINRAARHYRYARLPVLPVTAMMVAGALGLGFALGVIWSHL